MAATLMQSPVHRPPMDHTSSFDHARSPPSAPFASSSFERAPSPSTSSIQAPRSRTGSSNLASPSPSSSAAPPSSAPSAPAPAPAPASVPPGAAYPQHYPHFPHHHHHHQLPQHWPQGAAHPGAGFYAPPYAAFPGATGYQQQHPSNSAAWAHVYQQMVAGGSMGGPGVVPTHHSQDVDDYGPPMADPPRRRTASGPNTPLNATVIPGKGAVPQPQPFHPYKRGPTPNRGHRNDGASISSTASGGGMRSTSNPIPGSQARGTPPPADEHRRNLSSDSPQLRAGVPSAAGADNDFAPPRRRTEERRNSSSSHGSARSGSASPTTHQQNPSRTASPPTHARSRSASGASSPLTTGTIATNATNAARPSPLSQAAQPPAAAAAADQKKSSGIKGRFKPSLASDPAKDKPAPSSQAQPAPSRAEQSSASRLPRANGSVPLAPPSAPFVNAQAMGSDVSLAETQRTTQTNASVATAATGATGKSRRGLFRMRNKSSDNISLSSTVSSASMMIRKMGSLGKLARRNSLMGISKIFKDKPKDEDAALPEKQGILSFKKKSGKKSEASPAAVSHAYAELDRDLSRLSEDDDRVLSGLSPAAALARQHTVKSRAEQAKKDAEKKAAVDRETARRRELEAAEMGRATGVSTWDSNTTTRANHPTYAAAAAAAAAADAASVPTGPTNVVKVTPRSPNVVHHAFAVNQPDYDSDDSSEGDTIENVASDLRLASISEPADRDFEALWGKASIDPNARPKKGILKICQSNEDLEKLASQQQQQQQQKAQSAPTTPPAPHEAHHGGALDLASPHPERIDGNAHAPPAEEPKFNIDFSSFDTSPDLDLKPPVIYKNPVHNSSAPGISRAEGVDPHARAMSAPSRRRLIWAPECAVYSTYDALTYDRRSEPATCNRLTPELAMAIKQELNAFKLEMPVHPSSRIYTHYFA